MVMATENHHGVNIALIFLKLSFFKHALVFKNDFVSNHALCIWMISVIHAKITNYSRYNTRVNTSSKNKATNIFQ